MLLAPQRAIIVALSILLAVAVGWDLQARKDAARQSARAEQAIAEARRLEQLADGEDRAKRALEAAFQKDASEKRPLQEQIEEERARQDEMLRMAHPRDAGAR